MKTKASTKTSYKIWKFPISLSTKFFMRFRELLKWIHQRNQIDQRIHTHTHTHTQINFAGTSVTKRSKPKNLVNLNLAFVSMDSWIEKKNNVFEELLILVSKVIPKRLFWKVEKNQHFVDLRVSLFKKNG